MWEELIAENVIDGTHKILNSAEIYSSLKSGGKQ